jgi:hypothetical protein
MVERLRDRWVRPDDAVPELVRAGTPAPTDDVVGAAKGHRFEFPQTACKHATSHASRCGAGRPLPNGYPLTQTHYPPAETEKTCKCRTFQKRLKGFEPSTFCMASRACVSCSTRISPANAAILGSEARSQFPGFQREFTGVQAPNGHPDGGLGRNQKPRRRLPSVSSAAVVGLVVCLATDVLVRTNLQLF